MDRWSNDEEYGDGMGDVAESPKYYEGPHRRPVGPSGGSLFRRGREGGPRTTKVSEIHAARVGLEGEGPYRKPRVVACGLPFWTPLPVNFTNTANENITAYSRPIDFDTWAHGAWCSFSNARVQMAVSGVGKDWSTQRVPVLTLAGNSSKIQPIRWYKNPIFLRAQDTIQGNFTAEGQITSAQRFVFQTFAYQQEKNIRKLLVELSMNYWLFLDLSSAGLASFTDPIDDPLLIWGISWAAESVLAPTVQFTDERSNFAWSSQQLAIGAFGGQETLTTPVVILPKPYYLAPRARIRCDYSAAASGQRVTFISERILQGKQVQ
jgi:hypothetical protein